MPIYTYDNYVLTNNGYVAVTDGLCCGACCTDGDCANKNKCDCENYGGTWYGGQNCSDPDFSCESSSSSSSSCESGACCIRTLVSSPGSPGEGDYYTYECLDGRTAEECADYAAAENTRFLPCKKCDDVDCEKEWDSSSSSSSSSYSYSSYSYSSSCEYGACCVRTWEEDSGGDGSGSGGAYTYECLNNRTAEECADYASAEDTRFLPCKECDDVDCSKAWDSSSSSSSSSSPKYKGGWVCKPVWVCETSSSSTECDVDADCTECCPPGWTPTPKYDADGEIPGVGGCCPPGTEFDPETRTCGGGAPGPTVTGYCCDGECKCADEAICQRAADCTTYNTDRDTCAQEDQSNAFFPCGVIPTGACCTGADCQSEVTECDCKLAGGTWIANLRCDDIAYWPGWTPPPPGEGPPPPVCQPGETVCPSGCCPEPNWVCCKNTGNGVCAATVCDCPPPLPAMVAGLAHSNNNFALNSGAEMLRLTSVNTSDNLPYICDD